MREIFFHEDDFCQIEIIPIQNLEFCKNEIEQIKKFSKEHFRGDGWDDMYICKENPFKLADLKINLSELENALSKNMPKYDAVFTGYSSHREKCKNVYAFGRSRSSGTILTAVSNQQIVNFIWCSDPTYEIFNLPYKEKLLYVDWVRNFMCPLSEMEGFDAYLSKYGVSNPLSLKRIATIYYSQIENKIAAIPVQDNEVLIGIWPSGIELGDYFKKSKYVDFWLNQSNEWCLEFEDIVAAIIQELEDSEGQGKIYPAKKLFGIFKLKPDSMIFNRILKVMKQNEMPWITAEFGEDRDTKLIVKGGCPILWVIAPKNKETKILDMLARITRKCRLEKDNIDWGAII